MTNSKYYTAVSRVGCTWIWELECISPGFYFGIDSVKRGTIRDYLNGFGTWWEGPDWRKNNHDATRRKK